MNQSIQFVCPSCDAPLTALPGQTQVVCKYCGSTVIVPEELRTQPPAPPTERATPPPTFVPPPAPPPIIIVEQGRMAYTPPTPQMQPQRRRSRGCGCGCGCWTLVSLVICVALFLGGIGLQNLGSLSSVYAQIEARVPQIDIVMASAPATILLFTTSTSSVSSNSPVTLTWVASGASVTLERFDPKTNALAQSLSVAPIGNRTFYLAASGGRPVTFRLTARGQDSIEHRDLTINVR